MNSEQLLQEVAAQYAAFTSYQDEGVVLIHAHERYTPDEIHFKTHFSRSGLFRFEWTSHHPYPPLRHLVTRHVVGFDGKEAYSCKLRKGKAQIEIAESLGLAVAGATGISSGSAHTVLSLLVPDRDEQFDFTQLRALSPVAEDETNGVACYRLHGETPWGISTEISIGKVDLLIRQVVERTDMPVYTEEIRRGMQTNVDIPVEVFLNRMPTL